MTKKTPLYVVVIVAVIAAVVTFNASFLFFEQKYNSKLNETLAGYSYFDKLLSVDEIVRANYIGDIDDDALKASVVRGYLSGIGDKYSLYMTSTEYDEFMKELASQLQPGHSALFVLFRNATVDKALEELRGTGGKQWTAHIAEDRWKPGGSRGRTGSCVLRGSRRRRSEGFC